MSCGSTDCISTETFDSTSKPVFATGRAWRSSLRRWIEAVNTMYRRRRQRQALLELDDRLLADCGLSRQDAIKEARKPFWK
jgi:uncharacterized protein YjiS (DUF1127 family)